MTGYEAAYGTFGIRHESTRRHAAQVQPCQLSARLNKSRHRPRSVLGVRAQPRRRWRSGQYSQQVPCYGTQSVLSSAGPPDGCEDGASAGLGMSPHPCMQDGPSAGYGTVAEDRWAFLLHAQRVADVWCLVFGVRCLGFTCDVEGEGGAVVPYQLQRA
jgi:hypothetical protein